MPVASGGHTSPASTWVTSWSALSCTFTGCPGCAPPSGKSTQARLRNDCSKALMVSCTSAPWAKSPWFAWPPDRISVGEVATPGWSRTGTATARRNGRRAGSTCCGISRSTNSTESLRGRLDRLADAELVHQPDDDRALRAVDPRLDARVVADGHVGRLDRGQRPGRELARSTCRRRRCSSWSCWPVSRSIRFGTKLRMVPTTDGQRRVQPPVHDVDDRRAVALDRGHGDLAPGRPPGRPGAAASPGRSTGCSARSR